MTILKAYDFLVKALREECSQRKQSGIGGMWTPDDTEENGDLTLRTYSGGFEHELISCDFGITIIESYTYESGRVAKLSKGDKYSVNYCLEHYGYKGEKFTW